MSGLFDFVSESNAIEGIVDRDPLVEELEATQHFVELEEVPSIPDLERLVSALQPGARLRRWPRMDVRIGGRLAPLGGREVVEVLDSLLVVGELIDPWLLHVQYEILHPFTDGNGRSGRALWAWAMRRMGKDPFLLSFLRRFYYQTLDRFSQLK